MKIEQNNKVRFLFEINWLFNHETGINNLQVTTDWTLSIDPICDIELFVIPGSSTYTHWNAVQFNTKENFCGRIKRKLLVHWLINYSLIAKLIDAELIWKNNKIKVSSGKKVSHI